MAEKKLWTHADARAEMNRLVKGATDACKAIHTAAAAIEKLGEETSFKADAMAAVRQLAQRAMPGARAGARPVDVTERARRLGPCARQAFGLLDPSDAKAPHTVIARDYQIEGVRSLLDAGSTREPLQDTKADETDATVAPHEVNLVHNEQWHLADDLAEVLKRNMTRAKIKATDVGCTCDAQSFGVWEANVFHGTRCPLRSSWPYPNPSNTGEKP